MNKQTVNVLYVEDDSLDAEFAHTALKDIGCENFKLSVVEDGEAAMDYLMGGETDKSQIHPDMVLLDLNLPKIHGKDVLKALKASDRFRSIPVVILSTSRHQKDIDETYQLGASGYFTKPVDYADYMGTFKAICEYWIHKASLPSNPPAV